MKKSTTPPLPLIAKIAIAITFINSWVIFEETVVDRHGLWRYMPYYRVGLFCAWDAAVLAVTLLLLLVSVARSRRRNGPTQSITPPFPLIGIIATAMTFLSLAWGAAASLLLISLAIGMGFAGNYDLASDNYTYVPFCAVRLVASGFDRWLCHDHQ